MTDPENTQPARVGEDASVAVVAEHVWKFGWNAYEFDGEPGTREHCEHLARLAVEALGLEMVGWRAAVTGTFLYGVHRPHAICDAEPVYRLTRSASSPQEPT